jgi:hypothetical protein
MSPLPIPSEAAKTKMKPRYMAGEEDAGTGAERLSERIVGKNCRCQRCCA